jgi:hypothetical protein
MENNPLKKWERKPSGAAEPQKAEPHVKPPELVKNSAAEDDKEHYRAFSNLENGNNIYLAVARAAGLVRRFNYNGVMEQADDDVLGTQIILSFNFGPVVFIYGRNLYELILALGFQRPEVIREYNPKRWPEPGKNEAVITKIEIRMKNTPEDKADVEKRIEALKSGASGDETD